MATNKYPTTPVGDFLAVSQAMYVPHRAEQPREQPDVDLQTCTRPDWEEEKMFFKSPYFCFTFLYFSVDVFFSPEKKM
jgi:hypothetical protein